MPQLWPLLRGRSWATDPVRIAWRWQWLRCFDSQTCCPRTNSLSKGELSELMEEISFVTIQGASGKYTPLSFPWESDSEGRWVMNSPSITGTSSHVP